MTRQGTLKKKPDNPIHITEDLLQEMFAKPNGELTPLGQFVFYSKYSRWREDTKRREYWAETTQRSTEYNINLAISYLEEEGLDSAPMREFHQRELDLLAKNQFGLKQALSGRTLWAGGTPASYDNPMSNFNCSFMVMDRWEKLGEMIHLGMVGSGIGFRTLYMDIHELKPIANRKWEIVHKEYEPVAPEDRIEDTIASYSRQHKTVYIHIGDSKEGWRAAIDELFHYLTAPRKVEKVVFSYDSIRPAGERLKRFGGRAGGPETIKAMFTKFHEILHGNLTDGYPKVSPSGKIRPIHMLDLANAIGKNIQSGDVRSIAEIGLIDPDDQESIGAKLEVFKNSNLNHRYVSNNSVFYEKRPTDEQFDWQFDAIRYNGEPCFVNAVVARKRRKNFNGVNPCVEILLDDRGLCNLTTVNIMAFVKDGVLDIDGLLEAFELATRAGLRMTLPRLELPEWDFVQQRDRLIGVSMTGYQDAMDAIGFGDDKEYKTSLLEAIKATVGRASKEYAEMLGVNVPLLDTCVKPEGTQSQLFGGVSSGLHVSHSPYFLRRIRSSVKDPITKAVFDLGWRISAESNDGSWIREIQNVLQYSSKYDLSNVNDEDGLQVEQYQVHNGNLSAVTDVRLKDGVSLEDVEDDLGKILPAWYGRDRVLNIVVTESTRGDGWATIGYEVAGLDYKEAFGHSSKVVVDFPQESPAKRVKGNFSAIEQLEEYKMFLNHYARHNPSNTITVKDHEWDEVKQWVKDNWDNMLAVSFLSHFDAPYPLLPYQETSKAEVEALRASMKDFDAEVLMKYDMGEDMELVEAGCEGGACPVR